MSLRIIRAGILDTVQDLGRYGYQHLGINPGGAMDAFATQLVNMLTGNDCHEAVIELHFPASVFLFEQETLLALGGADFSPTINGETIPLWQPVLIAKNSILQFQKWNEGARCYLAFKEKLDLPKWLDSFSTNLKAGGGGFKGRILQKDDVLFFKEKNDYRKELQERDHVTLPWKADIDWNKGQADRITVIQGNEWNWLTQEAQDHFLSRPFTISSSADRMGYRLQGSLQTKENKELVSSPVSFGTIQLLPNGELIILMADHQTTGGYPRLAHVISAHLPRLAQKRPGEKIHFQMAGMQEAEELLLHQQQHLQQLQNACTFRLAEFFQHADN